MKYFGLILWLSIAMTPLLALGQAEKVLKNSEVSESKLIDALLPDTKPAMRSIRVTPEQTGPTLPVKQLSASMLITFATNSSELTPNAKQLLDTLGNALQSDKLSEFKFLIEGHADPRGGEAFNLQLSQQRAEKVVGYLSENRGIERGRLKPIGKGAFELLNTAIPDAPENRRVTVKTVVP